MGLLDENSLPLIVFRCMSICIINHWQLYLRRKEKETPSYDR